MTKSPVPLVVTADPPGFVVPRMADKLDAQHKNAGPTVWRVKPLEINEIMSWLPGALKPRWPRVNVDSMGYWLGAAAADRKAAFVRTNDVIGLFFVVQNILEPQPVVVEHFVRSRTRDNDQAVALYTYVRDWARSIGAKEFRFGDDTDVGLQINVAPALQDSKIHSEVRKKTVFIASLIPEG